MSPPTTPPNLIASSPLGRAASQTPSTIGSDDSALFELSFDYEFDPNGHIVRTKRPSGSRHPHSNHSNSSSPPTPVSESQESPSTGRFSGEGRDGRATPEISDGSPVLHAAKSRRASLSRSESMPGPTTATSSNLAADRPEEYSRPLSTEPSASNSRHFQRVASTPALPSTYQSGSGTVSGVGASSRIGASSKYSRPLRVSQEQYNEALRQEEYRWPDEKENLEEADFQYQHQHQPYELPASTSTRRSPPPPSLPVISNGRRSSPPRSDVPAYHYSRPTAPSQSHVTPAGPQRAYLPSGSSITPGGSGVRPAGMNSTASRLLKKKLTTGFGVSRISEVDTPPATKALKDMDYDYAAEGAITDGEAPSPMDADGNGWQSDAGGYVAAARVVGRQRAPSASAAAPTQNGSPKGLTGSSSVRPRRSASLSEGNSECFLSSFFSTTIGSSGSCLRVCPVLVLVGLLPDHRSGTHGIPSFIPLIHALSRPVEIWFGLSP